MTDTEAIYNLTDSVLRLTEAQLLTAKEIALFRQDYRKVHGLDLSDQIAEMHKEREEEFRRRNL